VDTKRNKRQSKLREAVDFLIKSQPEGEQNMTAVSYLLGVSPQYLYRCLNAGGTSLWTAAMIESATGGLWKKEDLSPKTTGRIKLRTERQKRIQKSF